MGLDSYWKNGDESGHVDGNFKVCGGMMSGQGNDSFRGKVYSSFVESITGVSLYQETITAETVQEMAQKMTSLDAWRRLNNCLIYKYHIDELNDFIRMFQLHADAGHSLIGWW
jgi:hypothetical protein